VGCNAVREILRIPNAILAAIWRIYSGVEGDRIMALVKCPECGKEISDTAPSCPHCGYVITATSVSNDSTVSIVKQIPKQVIGITVITFIIIVIFLISNNVLWGNDRIAYNIAVKCAERSFKDPTSLQLLGGTLGTDKDCMWCKTMAKNSYGSIVTDYYYFDEDGGIIETDQKDWCEANEFNVKKVNNALKRHFK